MQISKQLTVFSGVLVKDNKVLLVQRNEPELKEAHLKWEFPGGKVHFGETPEDTVEREIREETGIKVTVKELLPIVLTNYWDYDWCQQQTFCLYFLCSLISEHKRIPDHHVADVRWFSMNAAKKLESLPGTKEVIAAIEKRQKKK